MISMQLLKFHSRNATSPYIFWTILIGLGICFVDAIWMLLCNWSFEINHARIVFLGISAPALLLIFKRYRYDPKIFNACTSLIAILLFTNAAAVLSYLVVSTNFPLVDHQLDRIDKWMNFDWISLYGWLQLHPLMGLVLKISYNSLLFQMVFTVIFLGFTNRFVELNQFVLMLVISALITIAVSGFFPAAGSWKYYEVSDGVDLSSLAHFELLRSGALKTVDLIKTQGLISIPSFHAVLAILITYALRTSRIAFLLALVLNTAMLISIPTEGSHYLIDLLSGALVAVLTIWVVTRLISPKQ